MKSYQVSYEEQGEMVFIEAEHVFDRIILHDKLVTRK